MSPALASSLMTSHPLSFAESWSLANMEVLPAPRRPEMRTDWFSPKSSVSKTAVNSASSSSCPPNTNGRRPYPGLKGLGSGPVRDVTGTRYQIRVYCVYFPCLPGAWLLSARYRGRVTTASPAPPRPGALERWVAERPGTVDVLLVIVYELVTASQLLSLQAFDRAPLGAAVLLVAGVVVGALRRRTPVVALAVAAVAAAVALPIPLPPLVLLVVVTVVTRVGVRTAWTGAAATVVVLVVAGVVGFHDPTRAFLGTVVLLVGMVLGLWIRTRRAYVQALVELADRARAEQERRARTPSPTNVPGSPARCTTSWPTGSR